MVQAVQIRVDIAKTVNHAPQLQVLVTMDVNMDGSANNAILFAMMGHMSSMESVSNVRVCVRIMHLVINQPEDVIMGVAITGLEYFVKNVLMGFTTQIAAAYVVFV